MSGRSRFGRGLVAGAAAAAVLILMSVLLRIAAGVPLVAELASDRIIPTLSIRQFGRLARLLGGLERAKEITLVGTFALEFAIGTAAGGVFALLTSRGGGSNSGRSVPVVPAALALAWLVTLGLLWPVLDSSYIGLPSGPARIVTAAGVAATYLAYGVAFALALRMAVHPLSADGSEPGREVSRRVLLVAGAAAVLAVAAGGVVRWLYGRATVGPNGYDGLLTTGPAVDPVTPNDRFYVVTKNLVDPAIRVDGWRLEVTGLVDRPHTYTYEEIRSLPGTDQVQTLECISNGVGGGLISNAVWHGVPLGQILRAAGPRSEAREIRAHAADGYVHVIPLPKALEETTLLAYLMNGAPLPDRHGYPVRLLVPGTFGEVSVKWIDRLELGAGGVQGYYERQGWKPFNVPTMSRIDRPASGTSIPVAAAAVSVGGVAFAADRGVSSVEFSPDQGTTWIPARIDYHPSPLAWALWSARWRPTEPGTYRLSVRATDGTGALQDGKRRGSAPSGATGYHQIVVRITP
jgi:DMSO/TMAO reductase YedYZ molybdopterin-dependent catalytic subunit